MRNPTPTDPPVGLPNRQSSASRPARFTFWLLAVATLVNWNHLANMTVGTGLLVNLGLALCTVFLCLAVRTPLRRALGVPGFLIVAVLISYLFIGLSVALVTGFAWYENGPTLPFHVGLAALIVVATALGASAALHRVGAERVLKGILAILTVTCIFIPATPFLLDHVYTLPPHLSDVSEISAFRAIGTFQDPNIAGMVACYTAGLALSFLIGGRYRPVAVLVLILSSAAVILTFSKAAFLTLALLFLLFLWPSTSSLRLKPTSAATTLVIVLVAGGIVLILVNAERLLMVREEFGYRLAAQEDRLTWIKTFGGIDHDNALETRLNLWHLGASQITESPLFGHGITWFHHLEGASDCRLGVTCGVHNTYLMLWGEAGLVPLSLFLFFIGSLLRKRLTLPRSLATDAVTAWSLVFAVASMSIDGTVYSFWHAFILGLSCAVASHATREVRGRRPGRTLASRPAPDQTKSGGMAPSAAG